LTLGARQNQHNNCIATYNDLVAQKVLTIMAQASTNYKEAFALFDRRGNGRVTQDSLGDLLRACGQNPTLAEIGDLEKSVGSDCE